MSQNLLQCIQKIKQKYNKYGQFKTLLQQQTTTSQQMHKKIRAMSVAFQVISQQNTQLMRLHNNLIPILEQKDKQISMKQLEIRKYREQILQLSYKNQDLVNYSRKLANQYTILLNTIKDSEEVVLARQANNCSKLKLMQNQVTFLRENILNKNGIDVKNMNVNNKNDSNCSTIIKKDNKDHSLNKNKSKCKDRLKTKQNIVKGRKSIIHNLH